MSPSSHPCRVTGVMAAQAPVCVLLRRGPSRWTQVVRWDTVTDEFEPGQWIRARVYEHKCSIAPDGEHWSYVALNYHGLVNERIGHHRHFLSVSRVPEFASVLSWPVKDGWGGGAWFVTKEEVVVGSSPEEFAAGSTGAAGGLVARHWKDGVAAPRPSSERAFAWTCRRVEGADMVVEALPLPDGATLVRRKVTDASQPVSYRVRHIPDGAEGVSIPDCQWIDVDQRGRVVLARGGVVLRWEGPGDERPLIDLNDSRPPTRCEEGGGAAEQGERDATDA